MWVTIDPVSLLLTLQGAFGDIPAFTYQLIESAEVAGSVEGAYVDSTARLTRFGFKCRCSKEHKAEHGCTCGNPPRRKDALHIVWSPGDMSRNPAGYIEQYTHGGLLKFGIDVRDWCKEQNVPLPTSLAGIANALLRDPRFWPEARGRVPKATNERTREYLPGVYSQLLARTRVRHQAVAIDQRTAYHRAAQEVATPDPTTLFARGYFTQPDTGPLWAVRGEGVQAVRCNRLTGERSAIRLGPSRASSIAHGFATVVRFFPSARDELAAIDDGLVYSALGPYAPGKAPDTNLDTRRHDA